MNVVIVEDEIPAAEKLERYLIRYDANIKVLAKLQTVADSVAWFKENQADTDLIFMDIQLIDGQSFAIFEKVEITKPIIFTTAYDEYALKAFEVNSIAYLLKPISFPDLSSAIDKLSLLQGTSSSSKVDDLIPSGFKELLAGISSQQQYKSRFMIKIGEHIRSVTTDKIILFYAEGRNAYITNDQGRRLIIDYKLEELENLLDPKLFFRVNRTFIININAITDVIVYSNSRLKIITEVKAEKEIIVSREKVSAFKQWFDGE
ncbi:MAG: DNA-binding response regulator [Bacteroidetes bacterium]|nr:MAG: DNA-binding response regulator [Bacteroidota bacterium]